MSPQLEATSFFERVTAKYFSLVVAIGLIKQYSTPQFLNRNPEPEEKKDAVLEIIDARPGLRERVALAQSREIVRELYKEGEVLRKKMKDTLAHIKMNSLQATKEDIERILREGDYPTLTDENLQLKKQMVLSLNTMGYACKCADSWEVIYRHHLTVVERLITREMATASAREGAGPSV